MISIIIPYHNEGKEFISKTINSIKSTIDIDRYEIIIVDDYSSIPLNQYDDNDDLGTAVSILRHDINKGVGQAFDTGVKNAKYDNIILMGSDIRFESNNWATKMLSYIDQNPKSIICTTCVNYKEGISFEDSTKYYGANLIRKLDRPKFNITTILEAQWIHIPKQENLYEVQCILGAFYIVKKDWYNHIDGWWGHRQWGTLEPYISLKTQKMGGSTLLAKDVLTAHIFHEKIQGPHNVSMTNIIFNKLLTVELLLRGKEYSELYNHIPNTPLKKKAELELEKIKEELKNKKAEYDQKLINPIEVEANNIYENYIHYRNHYSKSSYYKVWKSIIKHISNEQIIVDIGCGPGQFMEYCIDRGIKNYIGYDISQVAIKLANNIYNNKQTNSKISLHKKDLLLEDKIEDGDIYVLSEILEHIEEDYKILNLIPQGKQVIITIPNYLGGSHVRKFDTINDIKKQFPTIKFSNYEVVDMGADRFIIIAKGIKQ